MTNTMTMAGKLINDTFNQINGVKEKTSSLEAKIAYSNAQAILLQNATIFITDAKEQVELEILELKEVK